MYAVAAVFGVPLLIAGAMINPDEVNIDGLIRYWLRREVAIRNAVIGGVVLFGLLYGAGWYLIIS
jgi:hypothetical protein